jgi:hypothetical protein
LIVRGRVSHENWWKELVFLVEAGRELQSIDARGVAIWVGARTGYERVEIHFDCTSSASNLTGLIIFTATILYKHLCFLYILPPRELSGFHRHEASARMNLFYCIEEART